MEEKNNLKEYEIAVNQGKEIVGQLKSRQAELAKLAVKVCTIRHGGISNGFYTIKQFALDIGMNPKTLQDYVSIYRNVVLVVKKEEDKVSPEEWRAASKVKRRIDFENTTERRSSGDLGRKIIPVKVPPQEIKKEYKAHLSGEATMNHKIYNWNSELLFISNALPNLQKEDVIRNKKVLTEMLMHVMFIRGQIDKMFSEISKDKAT